MTNDSLAVADEELEPLAPRARAARHIRLRQASHVMDNGMEWNGIGWDGMGWDGMEWNGTERNGMEWNDRPAQPVRLRQTSDVTEWNGME